MKSSQVKEEFYLGVLFGLIFAAILVFVSGAGAATYIKPPALIQQSDSTAASGGVTTLTVNSQTHQILTGTGTHTFRLFNASTWGATGREVEFINQSTGLLTVQYQDTTTLTTVLPGYSKRILLTDSSSANGTWNVFKSEFVQLSGDTMTGSLGLNYTNITTDRAAYVDSSRILRTSTSVSSQELEYLDGATANLQTQINSIISGGGSGAYVAKSGDSMTGALTIKVNGAPNLSVFRDTNAGDSTNANAVNIGNSGSAQGIMSMQWVNAAAASSPYFRLSFQPRNNADSTQVNLANFYQQKDAGADTATTKIGSNKLQYYKDAAAASSLIIEFPASKPTTPSYLSGATSGVATWASAVPQIFETTLAGTSTFTTPSGAKYLRVKVIGGGGGGGGSVTTASSSAGAGSSGGNTLFGVTSLVANGGTGGGAAGGPGAGGSGGSISFGGDVTPVLGVIGGSSSGISKSGTTGHVAGVMGAPSFFGGQGVGGTVGEAGGSAAGGSGSGGGGAGGPLNGYNGAGGGAGGYAEAIIVGPAASYSYTVGAGGGGGSAGTGGAAGGDGAQGRIVVETYF